LVLNFNPGDAAMNSDQLQGKWKQLKGSLKERWGKLTDQDLETIAGKHEKLIGVIQERYGIAKEEAQKQVDDWNVVSSQPQDIESGRRKAS
jgi:uncharacterized protein YjbJ (UPF0337 family)